MNPKKLTGKVAVVTGASKGIGASIARHLAEAGAAVVVNYASSRAAADQVVADITAAGGRALAVQANVTQPAEVDRLFAAAQQAFGRVPTFLASPDSHWITGQTLSVSGGYH